MQIGIDARYITKYKSGVGFYTQNLLESLASIDSMNEYYYLTTQRNIPHLKLNGNNFILMHTYISFENHIFGDFWQNLYLPLRLAALNIDVFHGPAVFLPLVKLGFKTVVTIHDLVSFLFPQTVPRKYSLYMQLMTRLSARFADGIIASSESTRQDLSKHLKIHPEKIKVIHLAVDESFKRVEDKDQIQKILEKYKIDSEFVLFIGNLEPRKNLTRLFEAFAIAHNKIPSYKLVVAGTRGWLYSDIFETVARLNLSDKIIFTGYIDAEDLPALYSAAQVFVLPSLYEGFGLPILEAMSCGAPVITSNMGSIPEVAGDSAILIDPYDIKAIADGLLEVFSNRQLREELMEKGLRRAKNFSWKRVAEETLGVYNEVYNRG